MDDLNEFEVQVWAAAYGSAYVAAQDWRIATNAAACAVDRLRQNTASLPPSIKAKLRSRQEQEKAQRDALRRLSYDPTASGFGH
jgi:hypothetical protein